MCVFISPVCPPGWDCPTQVAVNISTNFDLKRLYPYYILGYDFDNLPVLVIEIGHWKHLLVSQNLDKHQEEVDEYKREYFACVEKISNLTVTNSEDDEYTPGEFVLILDFDGLSVEEISTSASLKLMLSFWKGSKKWDNNIAYGFYINTNAVADYFLSLSRPLLSKAFGRSQHFGTRKQSWVPALLRKIPQSILPTWYGGDNDCNNIKLGCVF